MPKLKTLGPTVKPFDHRIVSFPQKHAAAIYLSPEWRNLIASIIAKRGRRCEQCGRRNCRIFGDHIHELQDGGAPLDEANVKLLCGSCHSIKTNAVRADRMKRIVSTEG